MKFKLLMFYFFNISIVVSQEIEYIRWNDLENELDTVLSLNLEEKGYEKTRWYYDNKNEKGGEWDLFPWCNISKDLVVINPSLIKNVKGYNFAILYSLLSNKVIKIFGPYYDDYISKFINQDLDNDGHNEFVMFLQEQSYYYLEMYDEKFELKLRIVKDFSDVYPQDYLKITTHNFKINEEISPALKEKCLFLLHDSYAKDIIEMKIE